MLLDEETCYRAMVSRDRRFEGRFIVGVKTTGVYCRPGCPARMPKRANVAFYVHAAAAEAAGLRACKRCRPDKSASCPAVLGTATTVARAVRLIRDGVLDRGGIEGLAARLGIGGRHLRRLFDEQVGASPMAIAQTERIHFARKLLEETKLPMTEVALGSGFGSVRRFNDAARAAFHETPSALRRRAKPLSLANDAVRLKLPFRPPLAWEEMIAFFAARAIPGVEAVRDGVYARTIEHGTLSVRRENDHLVLDVSLHERADLYALAQNVRRMFDLDADSTAIDAQLSSAPIIGDTARRCPGLRVPGAWDELELAVRAILGQQVSVKAASTLAGRLVARLGEPRDTHIEGLTHVFPRAPVLAKANLSGSGILPARADTIRAVAAAESIEGIRGIGDWTIQYLGMRARREPDAFPSSDLVLRKRVGGISAKELMELSNAWRPWRAYAAMHLWRMETGQ